MSIEEQIQNDMKEAMKAKDKVRLEAIRAVKSAFLLEKTSGSGTDKISDEQAIKIIQKQVKQRRDSAAIYKEQNREDLYVKEIQEADILSVYLPKQLSEEELAKEIESVIADLGASSMADMGKVMGVATKKMAGKADGKVVASKVRELLSK
ncbi:MAG: glutamyl-tRNA amidotransferase [Marinilabiliales bacterium]|nr:MAG: glutamyl-tRNA amidotransferase [Marinilabiliales bacterium]